MSEIMARKVAKYAEKHGLEAAAEKFEISRGAVFHAMGDHCETCDGILVV